MRNDEDIKVLDEIKEVQIFPNSDSSPTRTTGPLRLQIDAQNAYGVGFEHSGYGYKANDERFPTPPVPPLNASGVIRN